MSTMSDDERNERRKLAHDPNLDEASQAAFRESLASDAVMQGHDEDMAFLARVNAAAERHESIRQLRDEAIPYRRERIRIARQPEDERDAGEFDAVERWLTDWYRRAEAALEEVSSR